MRDPRRRNGGVNLAMLMLAVVALFSVAVLLPPVRDALDPRTFVAVVLGFAAVGLFMVLIYSDPVWIITFGVLLAAFSGNWEQLGFPIGPDRLLIAAGIAGVLYRVFVSRTSPRPRFSRVHFLLLASSLYAIGSALFIGTLWEIEPVFGLADKHTIVGYVLFALAPAWVGTRRQRAVLLGGLVALGGYLGLTAIFEMLRLTPLVFPRYIADPNVGIHYSRARGPFVESAANGLMLYACFIASALAFFTWSSRRLRALAVVVGILCGIGIILTLTRQIWLGSLVGTLLAMILTPQLRRLVLPAIVAIALVTGGALISIPALSQQASERASEQSPIWDRLNSNRAAVNMIRDRPVFGHGWYAWNRVGLDYYEQSGEYPLTTVSRVHNVWLSTAAELGLAGFAIWVAALLAGVGGALRRRRAPPDVERWRIGLIAVAVSFLVVSNFTPLGYPLPNYLIWIWAGVVVAGSPVARHATGRPAPPAVAARRAGSGSRALAS